MVRIRPQDSKFTLHFSAPVMYNQIVLRQATFRGTTEIAKQIVVFAIKKRSDVKTGVILEKVQYTVRSTPAILAFVSRA